MGNVKLWAQEEGVQYDNPDLRKMTRIAWGKL
jgi:hypothetical protein